MFRTKLLLALMGVVVAVTAAMLVTTQRRVTAGYGRLLRSEFQRQLDYHLTLQANRLEDIKQLGNELAAWSQEGSRGQTNFLHLLRPVFPDPSALPGSRDRWRNVPPLLSTNAGFVELLRRVDPQMRRGGFRGRQPGNSPADMPRLRQGASWLFWTRLETSS